MNSTVGKRIAALAIMVIGVLSAVLAPEGETVVRWVGIFLLIVGVYFLVTQKASSEQRQHTAQQRTDVPPLRWYQSAILWVPVVAIIIGILAFIL
ncbi:hypothetical protein [Pseudidiomarina insulisalsae]|uniref:Uncharacterized protein n=1 Tax=Pseudidiomarina insulisalsae TaxID=575789 RepID=A0A432YMR2_9GAMM|nr:hypothetical protein [Pseudidiomarina insulisalsae]RUO62145.1 hypothetical protein CWI71_04650 [Pseudidiomarina insulisalsae]